MLDRISLNDCRITQHEDKHIQKGNGSMYAYDIACTKGESFNVYSPQLFGDYRVRIVGYDDKLGDYLVLENGDTWFLFGHTKTELKKGDYVDRGEVIGKINLSGMSQNYHLHFEIWKDDYNISIKNYLEGNIVRNIEKTYDLRKQRGWYIGEVEAMDFIADFEGFEKCSYLDGRNEDGSIRFSIGYGTRSFPGECITKEEAKKRKIGHIEMVYEYIYKNVSLKNHNQRKAMASALYNLGTGSDIQNIQGMTPEQVKNHFLKFIHSDICKTKNNPKGVCKGLENRRNIEIDKFNSLQ